MRESGSPGHRNFKTELYHKLKQLNLGIKAYKQHAKGKSLWRLTSFEQASKSKSKALASIF